MVSASVTSLIDLIALHYFHAVKNYLVASTIHLFHMSISTPPTSRAANPTASGYLFPLTLVTSLFFLWGMAYGLLDVLNKHFQETLQITKTRSTLLQAAYFGAYFIMALPAGMLMNRYGYKRGIILGLLFYALGAFLFYPAALQSNFNFFLLALFILASGLACLETAANPYVTVLGPAQTAAFRLNLAQCFNGIGSFLGPVIAAQLFFGSGESSGELDSVRLVYLVIGAVVLLVAGLFVRTPLPEIVDETTGPEARVTPKPLFSIPHFRGAVVAQFFYVAAQVGVAALFINYCTEQSLQISNADAAYLLSVALLVFTIGRFVGTALLRRFAAPQLLTLFAWINMLLCLVVMFGSGWLSIYSLIAIFFFESIMFPTIFALGLKGLGTHTKKGSSFLIMAIVGGAIMPYAMGLMADSWSTATSYSIPLLCFVVVAWYGMRGHQIRQERVRPGE